MRIVTANVAEIIEEEHVPKQTGRGLASATQSSEAANFQVMIRERMDDETVWKQTILTSKVVESIYAIVYLVSVVCGEGRKQRLLKKLKVSPMKNRTLLNKSNVRMRCDKGRNFEH